MSFRGWTTTHDRILRDLVHHTLPGGRNKEGPAMGWRDLAVKFNELVHSRGVGGHVWHWNKVAARYYDYIKPRYVPGGDCYEEMKRIEAETERKERGLNGEGSGDGNLEGEEGWEGVDRGEVENEEDWTVV